MKQPRMAILGGGMLARAVARFVAGAGVDVRLWARAPKARTALKKELSAVKVEDDMVAVVEGASIILIAVPASAMREVANAYGDTARAEHVVIHATRGVCEPKGFLLPSQVIRQETCVRKIGVLGGPLYAPHLAEGRPVAAVLASRFDETCAAIAALTKDTLVRVHPSRDVIGVEIAGALSNVSALAAGMAEHLDLGDTARGVLLTRGLAEAARVGRLMGAEASTFAGLAGVGDLIPRDVASTGRNHAVGVALADGKSLAEATGKVHGEVEGVLTAQGLAEFSASHNIELPLSIAVDDVCEGRRTAEEALDDLLNQHLDLGHGGLEAGVRG